LPVEKRAMIFKGYFFDWDGCLADTLGIWMELYKAALRKRGIEGGERTIVRELFNDWSGPARFGVADADEFVEEIIHGLERRISSVRLNPSVRSTLARLRQCGARSAVLTGSRRSFVEPVLSRDEIEPYLELLVCLDDVKHQKPHPEAVERALATLELSREEVCMVGDSTKDVEMGRNAGITTVLYFPDANRRFYEPEQLFSSSPDRVIREFGELLELTI